MNPRRPMPLTCTLLALIASAGMSVSARAASAAAGTRIHNTATVTYQVKGHPYQRTANNVFTVDQLLDVSASWQNSTPVTAPAGSTQRALLFKVANQGNGDDRYKLAVQASPGAPSGFTAANCLLYRDSDHDGGLSTTDTPYPVSGTLPTLDAGKSMDILAVCDIPATATDQSRSTITLEVTSDTLNGKPGTSQAAPGGVTQVVGMSGNRATTTGSYQAVNVGYAFTSTQAVSDRSGGQVATSGSRITYTLTVDPTGTATGRNLVVDTPIPDHTTYIPGSLQLDGSPLGDSNQDGDNGHFDAATDALQVKLGDVAGSAAAHHIQFQVTIN